MKQEIRKGISSTGVASLHVAECDNALRVSGGSADRTIRLVALVDDPLHAELNIVFAEDLRHVVGEAVNGIAVLPRHISWVYVESDSAKFGVVAGDRDPRYLGHTVGAALPLSKIVPIGHCGI